MIKKPIIGVLGGMGPYASLRCYDLILKESIKYSNGIKNNDFPHIIIDNIPVKDLTNSEKHVKETVNYVKNEYIKLSNNGANIFIMPCNTMHLYYKDIFTNEKNINLSLIDEVSNKVKEDGHKIVGILGSITTIKSNLYSDILNKNGIKPIIINNSLILKDINNIIRKMIGGVKIITKNEINTLQKAISFLQEKGATAIILGCTELPIAFSSIITNIKLYDPLLITIDRVCKEYYKNTSNY